MLARTLAACALAASLAASACGAAPEAANPSDRPLLGLMTTLPLIWGEAADVGQILQANAGSGWVRPALERRFAIEPLDTLEQPSLTRVERLVLAQPRALSPAENVALDAWVRGGGRLLLFADPLLTRHSRFAIGDRRRPQEVVLLSPILAHWGLELLFDDRQAEGERVADIEGTGVPINLAGKFRLRPGAPCRLVGDGLLAECRLGKGRVVALADAALLDDPEEAPPVMRAYALAQLLALAFE